MSEIDGTNDVVVGVPIDHVNVGGVHVLAMIESVGIGVVVFLTFGSKEDGFAVGRKASVALPIVEVDFGRKFGERAPIAIGEFAHFTNDTVAKEEQTVAIR